MIPPLDDRGLLPPGEHPCTWAEVTEAFGFNPHRISLIEQLKRFVAEHVTPIGLAYTLYIDGSFVRSKPVPADIDIVLDISAVASMELLSKAIALRLCAPIIKRDYHVDLWLKHPALPINLMAFFQYVGIKGAAELRIAPKHPKGILRIEP